MSHDRAQHPHEAHSHELADVLDYDAEVSGAYLDEIPTWIAEHVDRAPERIVDIGAGSGSGTIVLAQRFPAASVHAIDVSPAMLERVVRRAEEAGVASRVEPVQGNIDDGWPDAATGVDLVWASSSLHEVSDPDSVLRDAREALRPGGLLAVIEMDQLPSFLPPEYPASAPGLESRVSAVLTQLGWNRHGDWASAIEEAGLEIVGRKTITTEASAPAVTEYARVWLKRLVTALPGRIDARDLETLEALCADDTELARVATTIRGARTAILARRTTTTG